ncbi:MAG: nucleoside 2-deoxyribosyltransferase [Planctomycetes bacterium]|nr:nucleoside 2-deoxyribosyltransferase [Planctomycetota bacterium]
MRIYLASPLFTQFERRWNREIADGIKKGMPGAIVILPQDFKISRKFNDRRHFGELFARCVEEIDRSDVLVAVLDGSDCDSGTAFEVGYAYAREKAIIGLRTDFRRNQEKGLNIMLSRACTYFIPDLSFREDSELIVRDIIRRLEDVKKQMDKRPDPTASAR